MSLKKALALAIAAITAVALVLVSPTSASAASYARSVGTPHYEGGKLVAEADVNTSCEGTFGCYTYVKIERKPDPQPGVPAWLTQWEDAAGHWANDGKNKVVVDSPTGCATYRTVVDSYNDAPGDAALGVLLGPVELNLGGGVKRYHKATRSQEVHICALA